MIIRACQRSLIGFGGGRPSGLLPSIDNSDNILAQAIPIGYYLLHFIDARVEGDTNFSRSGFQLDRI